jgi:hypothetical protein
MDEQGQVIDSAREILTSARALIRRPECWTRGALARDAHGGPVGATAPAAVQWCAVGAVLRASETAPYAAVEHAIHALAMAAHGDSDAEWITVSVYNDSHGTSHADVLRLFDRAIDMLDATRYEGAYPLMCAIARQAQAVS